MTDPMAYGDGTKTLRPDGRIQVTVWMEGRPRYKNVPARMVTKDPRAAWKLAERYRREMVDRREAGLDPSSQTLEVYLRSWLEGLTKRRKVRERTIEHYRGIVEKHIIPGLGHYRLDKLHERHVQAWLDADPAAPQTVSHHRAVLRRALNPLVGTQLQRNPAVAVELPTIDEYEPDRLTEEEVGSLLAATAGDRLHPLWRLALATGLRLSEMLGLARDDVDPDNGTVTPSLALARRDGQWVRVPPKTARKQHVLAIGPKTAEVLRAHLVAMATERQPDWAYHGLLFVRPNGEPYHNGAVWREFQRACDKAGIRRRRVHDLRGTNAALAMDRGVPEDVRMQRLGHTTQTMARHYAGASRTMDRDAAERLEEALG